MKYRKLFKDGPEISALGFGAWPIAGGLGHVDEQTAISTIHAALDNGITLIDTAQGYRASESILGKALKNGKRDSVFLASKVSGDASRQAIMKAMDNSLQSLGVDYVDLYQIHHWYPQHPLDESMEAMVRLQKQGKTRYIGVSNFNTAQMQQAQQYAPFQTVQPGYNMFDRKIEQSGIPFCEENGIGIMAYSALAKGLLGGKYTPNHKFAADDERSQMSMFQGDAFAAYINAADQLKEVAADKGLSLVELAIAWILRLPAISCVLVGAKTPAQVKAQLGAVGVTFSDDELAHIDVILATVPTIASWQ